MQLAALINIKVDGSRHMEGAIFQASDKRGEELIRDGLAEKVASQTSGKTKAAINSAPDVAQKG